jgi:hypothetical protein
MSGDTKLMSQVVFSSEANFYLSGKANKHKCHVWVQQNPRYSIGLKRGCLKLNVVCVFSEQEVYAPFFIVENTIRSAI